MNRNDNKKMKKIIVNGLTLSRVITTISMPFIYNILSAPVFLLLIGCVFLTDFIDGFLARKWEVSTLLGSWLDMGADKLLGASILVVLSFIYPVMLIPLIMEILITRINLKSVFKGGVGKSSMIGRSKMWIMGLSICALLLIGAAPELSTSISNIKIDCDLFRNLGNRFEEFLKLDSNVFHDLGIKMDNIIIWLKDNFVNLSTWLISFIKSNKSTIETVTVTSAIASETLTYIDYNKDYKKLKNNDKKLSKEDLIKYKEYIKSIWLDEYYYQETKDKPLYEKITPPEELEKIKVKKLELNKNKRVDK